MQNSFSFFRIQNLLLLFFAAISSFFCYGQADSLKQSLKLATHDTVRCNILFAMIEEESDAEVWIVYNGQLKNIAEKNLAIDQPKNLRTFYLKHLAAALNNDAVVFLDKGD
ncbi:MAG: hypothetical protein IAF38_03195, partial [Bacteroidia bacterium]|nr:hypothetical protein [Bacteroidia bacterium]